MEGRPIGPDSCAGAVAASRRRAIDPLGIRQRHAVFRPFSGSPFHYMSTKIYVGNLPWRTTDVQLTQLFAAHGDVLSVRIISDRDTGRSRGFAFVTMASAPAAQAAIAALHGSLLEGRTLVVNEANNQGSLPRSRPTGPRTHEDA